jgi:hypothetical protein
VSINSKRKGKTGELEACQALRDTLGIDAARSQQFCGAAGDADLSTSMDGVHFEVKRTEALRLYDAMAQAVGDCGDSIPVVLHRRNRGEWLCVVRLDDLPKLATQVYLQLMATK